MLTEYMLTYSILCSGSGDIQKAVILLINSLFVKSSPVERKVRFPPPFFPYSLPSFLIPSLPSLFPPFLPYSLHSSLIPSLPPLFPPFLPYSFPSFLIPSRHSLFLPFLPYSLPYSLPSSLIPSLPPFLPTFLATTIKLVEKTIGILNNYDFK